MVMMEVVVMVMAVIVMVMMIWDGHDSDNGDDDMTMIAIPVSENSCLMQVPKQSGWGRIYHNEEARHTRLKTTPM